MGKSILPPENMIAKNAKIAPQTGTQRKEEELDWELASCSKKMKGIARPGYFLSCGSVGRKINGKAEHDLQLIQDFE